MIYNIPGTQNTILKDPDGKVANDKLHINFSDDGRIATSSLPLANQIGDIKMSQSEAIYLPGTKEPDPTWLPCNGEEFDEELYSEYAQNASYGLFEVSDFNNLQEFESIRIGNKEYLGYKHNKPEEWWYSTDLQNWIKLDDVVTTNYKDGFWYSFTRTSYSYNEGGTTYELKLNQNLLNPSEYKTYELFITSDRKNIQLCAFNNKIKDDIEYLQVYTNLGGSIILWEIPLNVTIDGKIRYTSMTSITNEGEYWSSASDMQFLCHSIIVNNHLYGIIGDMNSWAENVNAYLKEVNLDDFSYKTYKINNLLKFQLDNGSTYYQLINRCSIEYINGNFILSYSNNTVQELEKSIVINPGAYDPDYYIYEIVLSKGTIYIGPEIFNETGDLSSNFKKIDIKDLNSPYYLFYVNDKENFVLGNNLDNNNTNSLNIMGKHDYQKQKQTIYDKNNNTFKSYVTYNIEDHVFDFQMLERHAINLNNKDYLLCNLKTYTRGYGYSSNYKVFEIKKITPYISLKHVSSAFADITVFQKIAE